MPVIINPSDVPEPSWPEDTILAIHEVIKEYGGSFAAAVMATATLHAALDIANGGRHDEITLADIKRAVTVCGDEESSDDLVMEVRQRGRVVGRG